MGKKPTSPPEEGTRYAALSSVSHGAEALAHLDAHQAGWLGSAMAILEESCGFGEKDSCVQLGAG